MCRRVVVLSIVSSRPTHTATAHRRPHHTDTQPTTKQKLGPGTTADEFSSSFAALVTDQSNLVLRALDLFRRKTGRADFFKVYLEKRTPVQAGLGGGSSNAATTLFAANQVRDVDGSGG